MIGTPVAPSSARLWLRRRVSSWSGRRPKVRATWPGSGDVRSVRYSEALRTAFVALGTNQSRPFFPHRVLRIPRAGPDALQLADWMCGVRNPDRLWLFLLHAEPGAAEGIDPSLFDDPTIQWHRQSHGLAAHVAYACAVEVDRDLHVLCYVSDLVQRIARRREWKTRVENTFGGWAYLLLNAIVDFAAERGDRCVLSPSADLVLRHADPERDIGRTLFDRVYDRMPRRAYDPSVTGPWWVIDIDAARDRLVPGIPAIDTRPVPRVVCVSHDTEGGLGHRADADFARAAEADAERALERMLHIEARLGVRTTYQVVGTRLGRVRDLLAGGGHALGFHSWDHRPRGRQLARCRAADGRIRGYRPPASRPTSEHGSESLARASFEWLATSRHALGFREPRLVSGVVRIPIARDDYGLHTGELDYAGWRAAVLAEATAGGFYALGLHDCYASHWLERYDALLGALGRDAELWTMDEVSSRLALDAAV